MALARADQSKQRFYSLSAQIQKERKDYYDLLEKTQKGNLDATEWLSWFLVICPVVLYPDQLVCRKPHFLGLCDELLTDGGSENLASSQYP